MEEKENKPTLNMAAKYGIAYVIVYETKPNWRQREINKSIGKDTRANNDFAREVIEFAENPENLTLLEDKLNEIGAIAEAARKVLPELKFSLQHHTKAKKK